MDYFIDPPNADDIVTKLNNLPDHKEVCAYIEGIFPNWIICAVDNYSEDYPHLRGNWKKICKLTKTKPQKIILVETIIFDNDHKVIKGFCEIMTRNGYCVRRAEEFVVCRKCNLAIPQKDIWHLLQEKGLPVPKIWDKVCSNCM